MSNGFRSSDLFVFSTQRGCYLVAAATPNKHMFAMYKKLSFSDFILFYISKNRHLKFLNLSPQGLISSIQKEPSCLLLFMLTSKVATIAKAKIKVTPTQRVMKRA